MADILQRLKFPTHPDLLVGTETSDDAGVFKLNNDIALIQTVDFLTPMVNDPYVFGQIAAVNAINDVYAMGGKPLLCMNIVCFPECEDPEVLHKILAGGLNKIIEAGAFLVGGHSVDDLEPKYGLAVSGLVAPEKIITNNKVKPGDILLLTKPIGSGVIITADKGEIASKEALNAAQHWMTKLNREEAELMKQLEINAATDITGFGIIGHTLEMAKGSNVQIELIIEEIPLMPQVLEYANYGLIPVGAYNNRAFYQEYVIAPKGLDENLRDILFSPETAGGMLIALAEDQAEAFILERQRHQGFVEKIGRATKEGFSHLKLT